MPNDPAILNLSRVQLLWCTAQITEDEEEQIQADKWRAEYAVSLTSAEGATRVQRVREMAAENNAEKSDEQFHETMSDVFGRDVASPSKKENEKIRLNKEDVDAIRVLRPRKK